VCMCERERKIERRDGHSVRSGKASLWKDGLCWSGSTLWSGELLAALNLNASL
jgi:hypothetical protein